MSPSINAFIQKWRGSAGNERANKDTFLLDLCEALEVAAPGPKDQFPDYCFEKDLKITHRDGTTSTGAIDLFKAGCFVLEAKQGSAKGKSGAKEGSSPTRGTHAYDQYMEKAFGQAYSYATQAQKEIVRNQAERLDAHRKAAQGRGVTITQMYNLLQKLRDREIFTHQDQEQHVSAQTEILRQLHDELDVAVEEA